MIIDPSRNSIICGDNLEWLKWLPDNTVDLCYIDPPFFSNRTYEVIWGNGYEIRSFGDRFAGGISHYIEWMRPRIELISRKLKMSGSLFVHCDWHAVHRLRCLLDDIFGEANFVNEIYWKRQNSHNDAKHKFPDIVDTILFYKKPSFEFKPVYYGHDPEYVKKFYRHDDNDGRGLYQLDNMASPNPRPNMTYTWKGFPPPPKGWRYELNTMTKLDSEGRIHYPRAADGSFNFDKRPRLKRYLAEQKGNLLSNLWTDIQNLQNQSREKLGYPTQKPEELVRRIIECSSNEGDLVLDCFAGGGTTPKVAYDMKRRFIAGDVSPVAVKIMAQRLNIEHSAVEYGIVNLPQTIEEFQSIDGHKFAEMICDLMGWKVSERKSNDGGVDGTDGDGNPIQIKNHSTAGAGRPEIQKFHSAIIKAKKAKGVFVAWMFAKPALEYIAEIKREHGIEIVAKPCSEVFGDLVLPHDKAENLKKLFADRFPEAWKSRPDPGLTKDPSEIVNNAVQELMLEEKHRKVLGKIKRAKQKAAEKRVKTKGKKPKS